MNNTCTKVDKKMLQRCVDLYTLSTIYQRRVAAIVHERWLATKQDTARHLKVFSQDTSADKIKDGITREEPFVNKRVPLALPQKTFLKRKLKTLLIELL